MAGRQTTNTRVSAAWRVRRARWLPVAAAVAVLVSASGPQAAEAQGTGAITGRIREAGTQRPLVLAEVVLEGTGQRVLADSAGRFRIARAPGGPHIVRVELLGYVPAVRTDVVVRPDRTVTIDIELMPAPLHMEAVRVAPTYFDVGTEAPASRIQFGSEEIRRAPGSAGDVSRILYGLPSVAKVNDQSNGLSVRGGTPAENLFLIDNIAVPNINHFPTQGATSGPIGVLNVELIRDVQFQAGGFPAQHGDRLSSVMEIQLREGDDERRRAQLSLDFTGAGAVVEGPLGGRASAIVSLRRSYLDLVVHAFDVGATVAPRFGDYAAKLHAELSQRHRVSGLALWADDHFRTDLEQALEHGMTAFGRQDLLQGTTGVNWTALWSDDVLSETSLAHSYARFDEDFTQTASRQSLFRNRSSEQSLTLHHRTHTQLHAGSHLTVGGEAALLHGKYDNRYFARLGPLGDTVPESRLQSDPGGVRAGAFASLTQRLGGAWSSTFGIRVDHGTLTGNTGVSPRASVAWSPTERTTLTLAGGLYQQSLPLLLLADTAHRTLRDPRAYHVVLAASHLLAPDLRFTLEAYRKDYRRLPMDPREPSLLPLDEVLTGSSFFTARETLLDVGRAHATGVEATLQKKLTGSIYGLLSATLSSARYLGLDDVWRPRSLDNRVIVAGEGGWRVTDRWEVSARWIYAGGVPRTPIDTAASSAANNTVHDAARINAVRFPAYHSLNVRADRRFLRSGSSVVAYVSVWNVYDRANVASYYWNTETQRVAVTNQWRILPVFGVEWNP
jgi:hypothetical protein